MYKIFYEMQSGLDAICYSVLILKEKALLKEPFLILFMLEC